MRIVPWLLTVIVCVVVTGGLAGIKYVQIAEAMAMAESFPPPYSVITTAEAKQIDWTPIRRLTGTVRAPEFVEIAAEATGRIVELPVVAGAVVQEGDVILKLFDEDQQARREALVADLDLVTVQLNRIEKLKKQSLASQDQLDTLLARGESLRAQIAATDAELSRLTLRAPFNGRLGIFTQSKGDLIESGTVMTTLTGLGNTRWVDFKIPQGVARVSVGDSVRLLSINKEFLGNAEIIATADALAPGLRAFDVRAQIDDGQLRHGELVLVEVRTRDARTVFTLPGPAVRWDIEGPHVFVMQDAGSESPLPLKSQLRRIQVHGESDGLVMASGDLRIGESVAVKGAFKLSDGSLAKVAEAEVQE